MQTHSKIRTGKYKKQPTRANKTKLESRHTWLRKGRMMNHLSPTYMSSRSGCIKLPMDPGADDVRSWVSCTGLALPNKQEGTPSSCPAC